MPRPPRHPQACKDRMQTHRWLSQFGDPVGGGGYIKGYGRMRLSATRSPDHHADHQIGAGDSLWC